MQQSANQAISSLFGRTTRGVQEYIQNIYTNVQETFGSSLGNFIQGARAQFEEVQFGETARYIQSMRAKTGSVFNTDVIEVKAYIEDMQQATGTMRRVVMCAPGVRELQMAGDIHAYGEDYVDSSPTGIGKYHYDYRNFTNTVAIHNGEEGEDSSTVIRNVFESYQEEVMYSVHDRSAFLRTIESANKLVEDSVYDMTSQDNDLI